MQPFTAALCQLQARDLADAEETLEALLAALDEAGRAGAQLVLLPECSYPAYYLHDRNPYARPGVRSFDEVCGLLAEKARRHGYWLAAGIAVPHADGSLTNSGLVFSPAGEIAGRYDKSFLWHFDNSWFTPGQQFPVFDAGFCKFGILICADGRQPEIARMLHAGGAEVICDLTAWVSWARTPDQLSTTQCEYLMPARAVENGAWVLAADKWGTEDGSIVYAGRSTVIDPRGVTCATTPSTGTTVLVHRVEPVTAEPITRRPALYRALTGDYASTPAAALETEPLSPAAAGHRVAVVPSGERFDMDAMAARYVGLRRQAADLVVFGGGFAPDGWEVQLPVLERAVAEHGGAALVAGATTGCYLRQTAALVTPGKTYEHMATHGRGIETGESLSAVIPTAAGNVGILLGDEGYVPEVGRALALAGADILAWAVFEPGPMDERIARTRADENRVYTALAWPGGGLVANPDGALITASPAGSGAAMTASTHLALSRWKERAPGTHVLRDRFPAAYAALTV